VRAYEGDSRSLASWYRASFGRPLELPQLVGMDTADYFAHLQRTHAPATAARRLVFLKRYVAAANRAGEASAELRERVEGLRPPRKQRHAPRGLTPEEARGALRRVQQDGSARDRAIVFTFLHTGLRVSELAGLERRDVDTNCASLARTRRRFRFSLNRRPQLLSRPFMSCGTALAVGRLVGPRRGRLARQHDVHH
jgi:integrase